MAVGTVFFVPVFDPVSFGAKDKLEAILDSDFTAFVVFALPAVLQRAENILTEFNSAFSILFIGGGRIGGIDVGAAGVLMVVLH